MTFSAIMACLDLESSNDVCLRIAVDLAAHFNAKLGSAGSRPPRAKKAPWS
jgi:hypothetical protein